MIETKKRGRKRRDYNAFLSPGETLDMVPSGVLRKRAFDQKHRDLRHDRDERSSVPDALDWAGTFRIRFPEQTAELKHFISGIINKIVQEVQLPLDRKDHDAAEETISRLATCFLSFQKNSWPWVRKTAQGFAVGGSYIPAYFGDDLVPLAHYYGLKRSETFLALYNQVLPELDKRYGMNQDSSAATIKQELAGTYRLPAEYLPWWKIPKPIKVQEVKPEVKSYSTNEGIRLEPPVPQEPPQAPVCRPPSLTRDLDSAASNYLLTGRDPYPNRNHLGPYGSKDRRFLYGEG